MMLLGIDTCGTTGTLALGQGTAGELRLLGSAELAGRTTAAMLIPALDGMLREAGVALQSITGIVVVDGPGSFTGIRIGLSAAKGLAEVLCIPVYAVSRLQVLAAVGGASSALLDAGRGEFYFLGDDGEECLLLKDDLAASLAESTAPAACEAKVVAVVATARLVPAPTAADAVQLALPKIQAGRSADMVSLDGRYLRRSGLYRTTGGSLGNESA